MTREEKQNWLNKATNEELLRQLVSFEKYNEYGKNDEDIELTRAEILKRMSNN